MTIEIKHSFVSAKPDDPTAAANGEVLPSHWNANLNTLMATNRLVGRSTAGNGSFEEISVGSGLTLSGGTLATNNSASWGNITGLIGDQTDLTTALDALQILLVSGTNIKTINGNSVLGSGDLAVGGSPAGSNTQVQFNNSGSFGASTNFGWNNTLNLLRVGASSTALDNQFGTGIGFYVNSPQPVSFVAQCTAANGAGSGAFNILYQNSGVALTSGTRMGGFIFGGWDGTATLRNGAAIVAFADGTWSASSIPSYITFETAPSGSTTRFERMRIGSTGQISINLGSVAAATTNLLTIRGSASHSGLLTSWENNSGTGLTQILGTGGLRMWGTFDESTSTAGVYGGQSASTPRMLFAGGTPSANWQIDNNSGQFRWFLPGVVRMAMTGDFMSVGGGPLDCRLSVRDGNASRVLIDALNNVTTPTAPAYRGRLNTTGGTDRPVFDVFQEWADITDATRAGRVAFRAYSTTTAQEAFRIEANSGGVRLGFYGGAAVAKPTITGSRGGNAALANLLTQLASLGLITDSTTA